MKEWVKLVMAVLGENVFPTENMEAKTPSVEAGDDDPLEAFRHGITELGNYIISILPKKLIKGVKRKYLADKDEFFDHIVGNLDQIGHFKSLVMPIPSMTIASISARASVWLPQVVVSTFFIAELKQKVDNKMLNKEQFVELLHAEVQKNIADRLRAPGSAADQDSDAAV